MNPPRHIALAMTGASGAPYGLSLMRHLIGAGARLSLMVSAPAQTVLAMETDLKVPGRAAEMQAFFSDYTGAAEGQLNVYGRDQWTAPVASGSGAPEAMVICPCTVGTLSSVACGASSNLMERAADVVIKEQKKLIMVVRETPFSAIHLENMLKLARLGVVILPANPGFYHKPESLEDIVDFLVARILEQLGIEHKLLPPWGTAV